MGERKLEKEDQQINGRRFSLGIFSKSEVSSVNNQDSAGLNIRKRRLLLAVDADYFFVSSMFFKRCSTFKQYLDLQGIRAFAVWSYSKLAKCKMQDVSVARSLFYASTVTDCFDSSLAARDRSFDVTLFNSGYDKASDPSNTQEPSTEYNYRILNAKTRSAFITLDLYDRLIEPVRDGSNGVWDAMVLFSGYGFMSPLVSFAAARLGVPTLVLGMHATCRKETGEERRIRVNRALAMHAWSTIYLNLFAELPENESTAQMLFCPVGEGKMFGGDIDLGAFSSPAPKDDNGCSKRTPSETGTVDTSKYLFPVPETRIQDPDRPLGSGLEVRDFDFDGSEVPAETFIQGRTALTAFSGLVSYQSRLKGRVFRMGRKPTYVFVRGYANEDGSPLGDSGSFVDFFLHRSNFLGGESDWASLEIGSEMTFTVGGKMPESPFPDAVDALRGPAPKKQEETEKKDEDVKPIL